MWMIKENQLDTKQESVLNSLVNASDRPEWVLGYAGTGKTIIITLAINKLQEVYPDASICFLTYTHALKDMVETGIFKRRGKKILVSTVDSFNPGNQIYDYIIVDEIQDVKSRHIQKIIDSCEHLIVAGDPEQSIYEGRINQSSLQKEIPRLKKHLLKNIYRLPLNNFQIANAILPDAKWDKDAALPSEGFPGKVFKANSWEEEVPTIFNEALSYAREGQPSAILLPTHNLIWDFANILCLSKSKQPPPHRERNQVKSIDYTAFNQHFEKNKIALQFLGSNNGSLPESDDKKMCYLMTYHSAKGLDFNSVFLPHLTSSTCLDAKPHSLSKEESERRLFYVALTRSRNNLFLSYHGEPNYLLSDIHPDCLTPYKPKRQSR